MVVTYPILEHFPLWKVLNLSTLNTITEGKRENSTFNSSNRYFAYDITEQRLTFPQIETEDGQQSRKALRLDQ